MGRKSIDDWRRRLPVGQPVADMDAFLKIMVKKEDWAPPDIAPLKGSKYRGLSELRWRSGNVPHRLIGYRDGERTYVLLVGCTHNARKYDPPSALDTAARYRDELKTGEARVCEFKLTVDF